MTLSHPPLTLFGALDSGHSYKLRLALLLGRIPHRYVRIDLDLPREQRPEPFRSLSPYGEVPVLSWGEPGAPGSEVLAQSNAVLLQLAERLGLLAGAAGELPLLQRWFFWEANRIGFSVPNLRYALRWSPQPEPVLAWLRGRATADLATLDAHLSTRDFVLDSGLSLADVSLSAYLHWLDQAGLEESDWPALSRWLERLRALPGFVGPDEAMR